ncbi:gamma-glutamyl-gamma-aminobutyrate hydrolase [Floricoccus tropicus]|uniref:Gamma-glutamyl-gamma-aminobutyrate hydrolase n=1 Tax=Floricoccus tropicus TaxID=1859473 RepID=A0A1E8GN09_9LACT|nr:gamma-glutamyl-gamma-aminobutyrate hydrolase family protein [Floricoccus tropicus]OFI49023.1 gamma-glutamyl-gamma-aminobutyrate hydrolase [Floricoccus tropicus]
MAIIGIAGTTYYGEDEVPFHGNKVIYTRKGFVDAIQAMGHIPLIIPNDKPERAANYINIVDKLILMGGEDVSPQYYNEEPDKLLGNTNPERDVFEFALIESALDQGKSIFGVCRGLQVLNVKFGGTLFQDVSYTGTKIKHMQVPTKQRFPTHSIEVKSDSVLNFLGQTHMVNSFHHQSIKQLADNFTAIAHAKDGIIEAISDTQRKIIAVQWHPEATWHRFDKDKALFSYFLNDL